MSTYKTVTGDTFSKIAVKTTGDDTFAFAIKTANPGVSEPLTENTVLSIPFTSFDPFSGFDGDELEILIDGKKINHVTDFQLVTSIDATAKGSFSVPNVKEFRKIFEPLKNPSIKIGFSGVLMHTGYCTSPKPSIDKLDIGFEAECSKLEKINAPISSYPAEFKDMNFQQITEHLCNPLGLTVVFADKPGTRFSRVDIEEETKLLDFLSQLAKQRNFVSTSNEKGEIVMWREVENAKPVAKIEAEKWPVIDSASVDINEDEYYTTVTGIVEAKPKKGIKAQQLTVKSPHITPIERAYTFKADDCDDGELETVVNTVAARMFAQVLSVSVPVCTWRDSSGAFWKPNTIVKYSDETQFIVGDYAFLVSGVEFKKTANEKTASLKLCMPGCYGGKVPVLLPWQ